MRTGKRKARAPQPVEQDAYQPLLAMLNDFLITPAELCQRWRLTPSHLCNLRRRKKGAPFLKIAGGSAVRYRLSEIVAAEIRCGAGLLTAGRVCLALAACEELSAEAREMAQEHVRKALS